MRNWGNIVASEKPRFWWHLFQRAISHFLTPPMWQISIHHASNAFKTSQYLWDTGVSDCQVIDIANALEWKLTAASRSVQLHYGFVGHRSKVSWLMWVTKYDVNCDKGTYTLYTNKLWRDSERLKVKTITSQTWMQCCHHYITTTQTSTA